MTAQDHASHAGSWSIQRVASAVALLALVPALLFLVYRGTLSVALALVNVLLIAGSVYTMLSDAEQPAHATQ